MLILLPFFLYFAIKKQNIPSPPPPKKKRKKKLKKKKQKPKQKTKQNKQGFIDHVLKIIWKYIGIMYI